MSSHALTGRRSDAPVTATAKQSGFFQDPQVFRHRRLRHAKLTLDVADRPLRGRQQAEDGAAVRLRDDFEGRRHGLNMLYYVYTCQGI